MDVTNTPALSRYFTGRIENAQKALQGVSLSRYADEVMVVLPRTGGDFARFVAWAEGMYSSLHAWCALAEVRQTHAPETLLKAQQALYVLARDARELLTVYECRRARVAETGLPVEGYQARAARTAAYGGA